MSTTEHFKKLPGSLSLQRGTLISDAAFYHLHADGTETPLNVMYHGIRGTQNVAGNKSKAAAEGNSVAREVSNIQMTESAKLLPETKLLVKWDLRFIDLEHILFACASKAGTDKSEELNFRTGFKDYIARVKDSDGIYEIARRYVRNIANGRWLWRNRSIAEHIVIKVSQAIEHEHSQSVKKYINTVEFNALDFGLKSFDHATAEEQQLAEIIVQGLRGDLNTTLHVQAIVDFGMGGVEVFPSQNYLEDKPKGFSRSLYQINPIKPERQAKDNQFLGHAAIRDQKIGNALRTIDTWYSAFADNDSKPIPIEPNGASLEAQQFYRIDKKEKVSAFDILKEIHTLDPNSEKGMFLTACLIRGGVYSEGE
ncbi:type I-F CRISPR-associated protein Csy3 [Acinetobacter rathckeae]|uniref:type I-F CRISPR-associated protein Csy3 n=1 Tax=Acinetobacter rathckeae TaxID=2605272 RepID=UPI0018A31E5C|nr:type I-F CRISPR-associated protein Csy3 [Acinetobacter rathckeae]MBF7689128.1 type I-F CRISPR-associated protein Csy3 [Acinetobacter rathckeae]MBF7695430.1 type I-F CRISPR-associated protein Csy3 [Acinetobacter rathckeae]